MIGLACLASFVAYLLRINMSVAGDALSADLGLTRVQLGIVLGAFAWGYGIFQFPGGLLGDRMGARWALTAIVAGWGLVNVLPGLLPGSGVLPGTLVVVLLAASRFLMGALQAPLFPVIGGATIRLWFPVAGWALPNGLTNFGATFGAALAGPLIGWLVVTVGWRQSFLLTAPLALGFAALWWGYYRNTPSEHRAVNRAEAEHIMGPRSAEELAPPDGGSWRLVLADRNVRLLAFSYFCTNYLFYFFFNWLIIYLVDFRKLTLLEGGWYAAAPWITGAFGALLGGLLSDRLARRHGQTAACRWPGFVSLSLAGLLILATGWAPGALLAVLLLSLCLGLQQLGDPLYWAATTAVAGRHAASACGLLNTAGNVVGALGALLVPLTVDAFGWPAALATTAGFALLGAFTWLLITAEPPAPAAGSSVRRGVTAAGGYREGSGARGWRVLEEG